MTANPNPDQPNGQQAVAQFLQDWTRLWREELQAQAQAGDPGAAAFAGLPGSAALPDMPATMEFWRSAFTIWAETLGASPASPGRSRDRPAPPRAAAVAAAPDARDAEVERLTRRIDDLEARLAKLEAPRRRRG